MTREQLISTIKEKRSYLCVGLDTDPEKIPAFLLDEPDPVFSFNRAIIDATREYCVAYKINTAFYEANGVLGWASMEKTVNYIGHDHFLIADAKRGDIGNTAELYAKAFFKTLPFDSITVAPYMGEDSIRPFLQQEGKWAIVLGLTSNKGAADFEFLQMQSGSGFQPLFEKVITTVSGWGNPGNLMFVVGATQTSSFKRIRELAPEHFFLVPGVGAQGGSLEEISKAAMNDDIGLLVNSSRAIIYASSGKDFAADAAAVAAGYQSEMAGYLDRF